MGKKVVYTLITPLPSNVPRQLAIELLHSHEEVAKLNPLVTGVKAIDAPRDAPNDEYYSDWYEISEVLRNFGIKKKIAFKGVFHNLPTGMQSHTYAPMGVDLRIKYLIGGNQPGEPRETRELGVDTPVDGLYLRQDVQIECNMALASFVKKETKDAVGKMVDRLVRKAELLDEGKLHAMFENGRLKTARPAEFDEAVSSPAFPPTSPPGSPSPSMASTGFGPRLDKKGYGQYHDVARSSSQHRPNSYMPAYQQQGYNGPDYARPGASNMPMINELPGSDSQQGLYPQPLKPQGQVFRSELPGDSSFSTVTPSPQPSPRQQPPPPDAKQQYHAFSTPHQQHPAQRGSDASYYSQPGAPQDTQRLHSYSAQGQGQGQGSNIAEWQRSVANQSQLSVGGQSSADANSYYDQSSRPLSNVVPDHQRFSQLSVQNTPPQQHAHAHARTSSYQGPSAAVSSNNSAAKCPVCGLFEGDEAAVTHHVSKAHFS